MSNYYKKCIVEGCRSNRIGEKLLGVENHATTWISTIQIGFLHYHWIKLAAAPVLKEDFCSATIEFCIPRRLQTQHHPLKQIFLMRVTLMTMSLII
ncbi:Uncharacterized protein APZ42_029881 [Daphnia magna]|uniref:Uncharacterized protein n=1 Tax=Daphnia magna TaxID=35525 RepID=A0A164P8Z7_9CRUS|nr:Uncharacterized protein APZ42_029881 [Daphnia magna]